MSAIDPSAERAAGTLLHIGTATVLLRCAGFTVLTDPNFLHRGERASLGYGMWSRRLTEPALSTEELPELDAVVLSHMHGDHFDRRARHGLDKDVPIVTTKHAAKTLGGWGFGRATALETWEQWDVRRPDGASLRVTSLPGKHAFGVLGALLPPVMGSLLEFTDSTGASYRVYLTGDTLVFEGLDEIGRRYPDIDLGVLHLGGTKIVGATVTMNGEMGADLLGRIPLRTAVPVHYDDYPVFTSPKADFLAAAAARNLPVRILDLERGERIPLP